MSPSPTPDMLRALARSSPWRWRTLRFTYSRLGAAERSVRAWVRRPGLLRVEDLDGELIQVVRDEPPTVGVLSTGGGSTRSLPWPHQVEPELGPDGLVRERPRGVGYDDPMYQNYAWVALLDPAELADGGHEGDWEAPVLVEDLRETEHHGRAAWQARLRPTASYDPRCSCCPLLPSAESDAQEAAMGMPTARDQDPTFRYADAHLVRLDVETGVCVYHEVIGGTPAGSGHDVVIEAVDEPLDDELFVKPPRTPWASARRSLSDRLR